MDPSRRKLLYRGASLAGAGVLGASVVQGAEAKPAAKKMKPIVGACGLCCNACPLMKAKKCKGCASGKDASAELLKMKPCPVLKCAAKKKIDYCGTGCKMFTKCKKLIGQPYAKAYMEKIEKRQAKTT